MSIATLIGLINGLISLGATVWRWITGRKADTAAATENAQAREVAQIERNAAAAATEELTHANEQVAADRRRVAGADSLRTGAAVVAEAIQRANAAGAGPGRDLR